MNHYQEPFCLNEKISRRTFMRQAAAAAAIFTIVPRRVLGGRGHISPSSTLNIAGIGVGGVGKAFLAGCAAEQGVNILALCDVDDRYAAPVFASYPKAARYRDFREMLEAEKSIDAVMVATPDHTHAVISSKAIKMGKNVLCVKPLTRTIYESRMVAEAARKAKVATQVTASSSASDSACTLCEMIWDGAIGPIREVHCWSNRPLWPQGMTRPDGQDQVPAHLDWDMWIGPAPMRPFKASWPKEHLTLKQVPSGRPPDAVYHPWNFRGWWDFGTGALGDMGCHHFNTLFRALKLGHPTSVQASSTKVFAETAPLASIVIWDFPARADMPAMKLFWYDGGLKPPRPAELDDGRPMPAEANFYVGDKGKILGGTNDGRIIPDSKMQQYRPPPQTLRRPALVGNLTTAEWIAACRGGEPASCNFDVADLLTEAVLLGNIAIRTGKKLCWDSDNMKVTNDEGPALSGVEGANQYIKQPYRSGWSL